MDQKTFVFYKEWSDVAKAHPDHVRLMFYEAIITYATTGVMPDLPQEILFGFMFIKGDIDRDKEKYNTKVKVSQENGKLGGRPKNPENPLGYTKPRKPTGLFGNPENLDNDNVDDNEYVNEDLEKKKGKRKIADPAVAGQPPKTGKSFEEREKDFYQEIALFKDKYPAPMLRAFYDYWREPNRSGAKMQWELKRTWSTPLRLATWDRNQDKFEKPALQNNHQPLPTTSNITAILAQKIQENKKSDEHVAQ